MADYNSAYTGAEIDQGVGNGLAAPTTYAPIAHDSTATTYGKGTDTKYGHLKLSSSTSSTSGTSGGIAATPSAVKAAYDLANGKQDPATTLAGYGITDAASSAELGTFVRPNLLDNAYFVGGGSQLSEGTFPINQRGNASYGADVYSIDRWKANTSMLSVTVNSDRVTIASGSINSYGFLYQGIESPTKLNGKTITMSIICKGTNAVGLAIYDNTKDDTFDTRNFFPVTAEYSLYSATVTLPDDAVASGDTVRFLIYPNDESHMGQTLDIIAVKLEFGDTQTLAHQESGQWVLNEIPDYGEELARCQRHYLKMPQYVRFPTTRWLSSEIDFLIPISVTMRTTPSIIGTPAVYNGNTAQTGFTFSVTGMGYNALAIRAAKNNHGLTDQGISLYVAGTALSADL